jgi:ADP-dependent phosphofructokinase/glucokinase
MESMLAFGEVLEVVDRLSLEEQERLIEVVRRRVIERRREELAKEIQDAQKEFQAGHCHPVTPDELVAEILS